MTKRTVLASLMLLVGGLSSLSLSVEGLALGVPLLLAGSSLYLAPRVPLGRIRQAAPAGMRL